MLITEKKGHINSGDLGSRSIEHLYLEWYELRKRIIHKQTENGRAITIKFLKESPDFKDGDILWYDAKIIIAISILPCKTIILKPKDIMEASAICYEIGNKHLPLFFEDEELLIPFDKMLFSLLEASGYEPKVDERKLSNPIKTTVSPHSESTGLFTNILNLTTK